MQYFVYIGRHNKTIELFSKLSTGVFYAAPNCYKATKVLDKIREKYDAALFIEQVELSKDIADIRSIRKMYPGLYMVLVIDSITKEEATEYLKAGVNNTIKYETNSEVLKDLSTFLTRRKEQKIERKVHNDETKGFRDMGGRSCADCHCRMCVCGGDILSLREAAGATIPGERAASHS